MLDDHGIEILVFLALFFAFEVHKFYGNPLVSSDHAGTIRQGNTCFFPENRLFGSVQDFRVDHDGGSEEFVFFRLLLPLTGCYDSDILSDLRSG